MRKARILFAVGMVVLFIVACGGGGGGVATPSGGQTPTVVSTTPTAVQITEGELVQVTGTTDFTLEPNIIELKLGKAYKFQFLNRGTQFFVFLILRWDVRLSAAPGQDSEVSLVVVPDAVGDFGCSERNTATSRGMKCIVRVSQ